MHYVFFGTPDFAAIILEKLINVGMPPALVVTNPDKLVGRKQILTSPPVKIRLRTQDKGLKILQPNKLSPELFRGEDWDFFLVVAYGKIIPKNILDIPRLGALNVHPSLLPKHRGPTPIQTAILNGDETTGVSIMLLDEEIDHGAILSQKKLEIGNWKLEIAQAELARLGAEMLIDTLPKFMKKKITPVPQEHAKATFTKKFTTEDAFVPYEDLTAALEGDREKAIHIDRVIRALNPEPGVWTQTREKQILDLPKNKRVKLLDTEARNGKLILKQAQVEGQRPRAISNYSN